MLANTVEYSHSHDLSHTMAEESREIEVHFLKTAGYRTYYIDGAFGGVTPRGKVYIELFLERGATPNKVVYEVRQDSDTLTEKLREGKDGIVREIECGLVMDVRAAIALKDWLTTRIEEFKQLSNPIEDDDDSP